MNPSPPLRLRLWVLVSLFTLAFAIILGRAVWLAERGSASIGPRKDKARIIRGRIEDRRGFPLALSRSTSTIGIAPAEIYDREKTAEILSSYLPLSTDDIIEKIYFNNDKKYFYLARQIDDLAADQILDLRLPGVYRERSYKRVYPYGSLASNLLGFVGQNQYEALAGIERDYNDILTSTREDSHQGHTLQLTLDTLIQYKLEQELGRAFEDSGAKRAAGMLMNVRNGEILAMASLPNFDPNRYYKSNPFQRGNWNIRFNYEPGSTVKIFMAAMLLNEGLVDPQDHFYCDGELHFGSAVVQCKSRGKRIRHGSLTLAGILRHSCNVGIIKAMKRMPRKKFYKYMKALGFGERTDVLPPNSGETSGYFPSLANWVESTSYYTPIGQGFSVTPIQLLRAGASLANGGRLLQPVIVRRILASDGHVIEESQPYENASPLRPQVLAQILRWMQGVVKNGTGRRAQVDGIAIAGKTGTGEKSSARGYLGKYVVSFMGFFPADHPQYGMLILFDEPRGNHSGGSLAAPVFARVVKAIRPYFDRKEAIEIKGKLPPLHVHRPRIRPDRIYDFRGLAARDAIEILSSYYDLSFELKGSGYVYAQKPEPGSLTKEAKKVILYLDALQ